MPPDVGVWPTHSGGRWLPEPDAAEAEEGPVEPVPVALDPIAKVNVWITNSRGNESRPAMKADIWSKLPVMCILTGTGTTPLVAGVAPAVGGVVAGVVPGAAVFPVQANEGIDVPDEPTRAVSWL